MFRCMQREHSSADFSLSRLEKKFRDSLQTKLTVMSSRTMAGLM